MSIAILLLAVCDGVVSYYEQSMKFIDEMRADYAEQRKANHAYEKDEE